jgi:cytidylate kinase
MLLEGICGKEKSFAKPGSGFAKKSAAPAADWGRLEKERSNRCGSIAAERPADPLKPGIPTMNASSDLDRCFSFVRAQLQPPAAHARKQGRRLALTISRQTGTGGLIIARKLAAFLQADGRLDGRPWTVLDKELVGEVVREHGLPRELTRFMPEDRVSQIEDMLEELLGLHPPTAALVRATAETILHLADLGNVILVGRGATVITAQLPHVFHVRLVGSPERRIARLRRFDGLDEKAAREAMAKTDRGRARYLKRYFGKDIEDVLLYDLTINTDRIADEVAARTIAEVALAGARVPGPLPSPLGAEDRLHEWARPHRD